MIDSGKIVHCYDFSGFRLDVTNCLLSRDGEHIPLTQKSLDILRFLVSNRKRILRKSEIFREVWTESFVEEANLAQHIYLVRKALRDAGCEEELIETVPKLGYRFTGEVTGRFLDEGYDEQPEAFAAVSADLVDQPSFSTSRPQVAEDPIGGKSRRRRIPALFLSLLALAAATLTALGANYLYSVRDSGSGPKVSSISVLPFTQIGDERDEKFTVGIADTLISRLGAANEYSVTPTSTVARFTNGTPREIGKELGVDAVLTGTIQREGDRVRVNVQLIDVATGDPVWAEKIDSNFSDIFSLQDQLSEEVVAKLSQEFHGDQAVPARNSGNIGDEALTAYRKGVYFWKKRTPENLEKAKDYFAEALRLEPQFANAAAMLADCYSLTAIYGRNSSKSAQALTRAKSFAAHALELDRNSSLAYSALASIAQYERDAPKAVDLLKKAIRLDPDNAVAHLRMSWMHALEENLDKAIDEMKLAQKLDPESQTINLNLARLLRLNRQTDEALRFGRKAAEIDPGMVGTRVILAEIYEQKGMLDRSMEELRSVPKSSPEQKTARLLMSRVLAKKGDRDGARKMLRDATRTESDETPAYEVAAVLATLGEETEAVKELRRGDEASLIHFLHVKYDYNLDPLRNSPDFQGLVSQTKKRFITAYEGSG